MAFRSRATLVVLAIVATFLIVAIFVVCAVFNFDRYRPRLIADLRERTGKQVEIGRLTLTLSPLTIHINDLAVRNPPPFPADEALKVRRIDAVVDPSALLHGSVVIKSLLLYKPIVHLSWDPDGTWNLENSLATAPGKAIPQGVIAKVEIKEGQLAASNLLPSDAAGPVFLEAHDISGEFERVSIDAIINPASTSMGGQGNVKADRLSFGAVDASNLSFKLQVWARQVFLADVRAEVYGGRAAGMLFFDLSKQKPLFRTSARFSGVSIADVLEPFENGRGKMTGKMEGDVTLAGEIQHSQRPLAGIHGEGHLTVRNGQVPSLKLNENLMKLVHFNDQGPAKENPSSFKFISTDLELADLRIMSKVIDIDGYGVDIDGSGSVNVDGSDELNYQGEAKITTKQGFFTNTFARLSGATLQDGQLSFPFRVRGTIESPVFSRGRAD
jgi:uncharacterized protein involved in outer membrane biogenesis